MTLLSSSLRLVGALACAAVFVSALAADEVAPSGLKPFDARSIRQIREAHKGRPFILAFWSLHCAPCKEEMPLLKELQAKFPNVPVVLVSTDPESLHSKVSRQLAKYELGAIQCWAFADEFTEKVRFSVDPEWQGELPRTYLFDPEHRSTARSGVLDRKMVEAWLADASKQKS